MKRSPLPQKVVRVLGCLVVTALPFASSMAGPAGEPTEADLSELEAFAWGFEDPRLEPNAAEFYRMFTSPAVDIVTDTVTDDGTEDSDAAARFLDGLLNTSAYSRLDAGMSFGMVVASLEAVGPRSSWTPGQVTDPGPRVIDAIKRANARQLNFSTARHLLEMLASDSADGDAAWELVTREKPALLLLVKDRLRPRAGAHTVLAYDAVEDASGEKQILVYDPDRVVTRDTPEHRGWYASGDNVIRVHGDGWSFLRADGQEWSDGFLFVVPYSIVAAKGPHVGGLGFGHRFHHVVQLSGGASLAQVTDADGKRLYTSTSALDTNPDTGLLDTLPFMPSDGSTVNCLFFVLDKLGGPRLLDFRPSQGGYQAAFALQRGRLSLRAFGAVARDTIEVSRLGSREPRIKLFNLAAVGGYELVFRDGSRDGEIREYRLMSLQMEPDSLVDITFLVGDGSVRVASPLGTTVFDLELRREASGVAVAVTRPGVVANAGQMVTMTPDDWSLPGETSIELEGTRLPPLSIESYLGARYRPSEGPVGHDFGDKRSIGAAGNGATAHDDGADTYTVVPSFAPTAETGDAVYFVYRELRGDFDFAVELIDDPAMNGDAALLTYGLMARRDASPAAKSSYLQRRTDERGSASSRWSYRAVHGDPGSRDETQELPHDAAESPPAFLRMVRRGDTFYGYVSDDAERWIPVGADTWHGSSSDPVLAGFAASSPESPGVDPPTIRFRVIHFGPTDSTVTESIHDDATMDGELVYEAFFDGDDESHPDGFSAQAGAGTFTPAIRGRRLRLSDEAFANSSTSAFSEFVIDDIDSAIYQFDFDVYFRHDGASDPGQGLTFALMAGTETDRVGSAGSGLGYRGLSRKTNGGTTAHNSVAFEMELARLDGEPEPAAPSYHVGIDVQGRVESVLETEAPSLLPDVFAADGVHARVFYNRGHLEVYLGAKGAKGVEARKVLDADVLPVSFGAPSEQAVFGFTASTGESTVTAAIDNLAVTRIDCDDIPEVAVITGAPEDGIPAGSRVVLDGSASNGGPGDESEPVSLHWTVVLGPATIDGPDFGRTAIVEVSGEGPVLVELVADDGDCDNPAVTRTGFFAGGSLRPFRRGDSNGDGVIDIADPLANLFYQFPGTFQPGCLDACDFDDDGEIDIADPIGNLTHQFLDGPPPAFPGKDDCGGDPSLDELSCDTFESCP